MKKTFQVSISGRIFTIEEDAYSLLLDYLSSLSQVFKGAEGQEIVSDIEGRICEIFSEKGQNPPPIITLADVEMVIETVGKPSDLAEDEEQPAPEAQQQSARTGATPPPAPVFVPKKFYRSAYDRVIGGVIGGIGIYTGWNINLMRILIVVLGFFTGFFPLFLVYCIFWMIVPLAKTPEQQLEQLGRPVTVDNIGNMVRMDNTLREKETRMSGMHIFGNILMGMIGLFSVSIGLIMIVGMCMVTGVAIGSSFSPEVYYHPIFDAPSDPSIFSVWLWSFSTMLAVLLPCIAVSWAACSVLFKSKGAGKVTWISGVLLELIAITTAIWGFAEMVSTAQ